MKSSGSAWIALADIFLLRAKNLGDLMDFIGWTEDELCEFNKTGVVPERLSALTGCRTVEDLGRRQSLRADKKQLGPGD